MQIKNKVHSITTKGKKAGFTLIELLVVISIIGLLSSVVLANVNRARLKAVTVSATQTIQQYDIALQQFFMDHDYYPPRIDTVTCLGPIGQTCIYDDAEYSTIPAFNNALQPYMSSFPYVNTGTIFIDGDEQNGVSYQCTSFVPFISCYHAFLIWAQTGTSCQYGLFSYTDGVNSSCYLEYIAPLPY